MSDRQSHFEYGFSNIYDRDREVVNSLTDDQRQRYIPHPQGYTFLVYDTEPAEALWDDANSGNHDAIRLLGVIARQESKELRFSVSGNGEFREALPGYDNERFIIPRKRHEPKDMTVEEFEIECLEAEIEILKVQAAQTRKDFSMKPARKRNNDIDSSV